MIRVSSWELLKYLVFYGLKTIHTMAKLHTPFNFNGTLAGVTAYTRIDSEEPILRSKGGPTREQIMTGKAFDVTRRNISEFSGRSSAGKWIKVALMPLKLLADHNLGPSLNPLLQPIQESDTESEFGKRHVRLSQNPHLLEGFEISRRNHLDSVLHNPVPYTLDKSSLSARVTIGALLPKVNFSPLGSFLHYRIVAVLGAVPDLFYTPDGYDTEAGYELLHPQTLYTDWFHSVSGSAEQILELSLPTAPAMASYSLLLSVGVSFGRMGKRGFIEAVKYAGGGRILAAV